MIWLSGNTTIPRTCFFVGTTNKKELLNDPTGDRRYWVLDVLIDRIPCDLLAQERDLIWAAAVQCYRKGERWNLSEEESTLARSANEDYHSVDPWEDAIASYVLTYRKVTTAEILSQVLKLDLSQNDHQKQRRVINILQRLGCESKTVSKNGKKYRAWVYTPPDEGNTAVTASTSDVTPIVTVDVTAQIQSPQPIQLTVTPVTPNIEDLKVIFEDSQKINTSNKLDVTGVTAVTGDVDNSQKPCNEDVSSGNADLKTKSGASVSPQVTALPESEWLSEENLASIASDIESCQDIEMIVALRSIYNFEALRIAARRISQEKQSLIRAWISQLDTQ